MKPDTIDLDTLAPGTAQVTVRSPLGAFVLWGDAAGLSYLFLPSFDPPNTPDTPDTGVPAPLAEAAGQLRQYLAGRRREFDLDLNPAGTDFQRSVWLALADIPYGETITYAELARRVGRPKAWRAVGQANGANPLPVVLPCHRVVASGGGLGGYGGGTALKEQLLALESSDRPA